jgi:hypothetical protein
VQENPLARLRLKQSIAFAGGLSACCDSGRAAFGSWRLGRQHAAMALVVVGVAWFTLRLTTDEEAEEPVVAHLDSATALDRD